MDNTRLNTWTSPMYLNRRQTLLALAATAGLPLITNCARNRLLTPTDKVRDFDRLVEEDASALLTRFGHNLIDLYPERATSLGVDTGDFRYLRGKVTNLGLEGQRNIAKKIAADLALAEKIDSRSLSFSARTSIEVVKSAYRTALEGFALPYGDVAVGGWRNSPYTVIQNVGAYLDVPQLLTTDQPIENKQDAEFYLSRLNALPAQLDGELERIVSAREMGLVPPVFLSDKAISQIEIAMKGLKDGGALVRTLDEKTKSNGIDGDWVLQAKSIVSKSLLPALARQKAELEMERAIGTEHAGMWSRPYGDAYYQYALKAATTTNKTPNELHQIGLDQVAILHSQMDPILRSIGYSSGSVGARMQALAQDPKYKFSPGDQGRAEIMEFIAHQIKVIREKVIPKAFNTMVPGNIEVKRMSPEQEPGAPGAYGGAGSIDGKIPGRFWINLYTTDLHSKFSLPDLTAHEALPGHVWQGEYANQLPLIRALLGFNAYSEGWALYAEQLVDELGLYDDFPVGRLGYLQSIAFRACRLVVDTGIHAKRWTREQGVDYFVKTNGSNPIEVAGEVDRYCSWPGQACGYKIGHNLINQLRDKARAELLHRYDLKAFNDKLVLGGNVPLDVLTLNIEDYIQAQKT